MNNALLLSVSLVLVFSVLILCDEYTLVQDTDEISNFETMGNLLTEYMNASIRTLNPEERNMFYDSYLLEEIEKADNRSLERRKHIPTLDYSNINDTDEKSLFQTCGTLLQHYWENYSLRNLTSSERNFYYDDDLEKEIEKENEEYRQELKDKEWYRKMEDRVVNEEIDSMERQRTTHWEDLEGWMTPVPKTTVMMMSPLDNLDLSEADNVSMTDISEQTYMRGMKYGDAPRWLADRFDQIQDAFIKRRDKNAIYQAYMIGMLSSTGRIVTISTASTRKRRRLTHKYDRTVRFEHQVYKGNKTKEQTRHYKKGTKSRLKRNVDTVMETSLEKNEISNHELKQCAEDLTTKKTVRKRQKITNQDGVVILKEWADMVRRGELELKKEDKKEKKMAEKLKLKLEKKKIKEEQKKLITKLIRSTKFTRKSKTPTTTIPVTFEDSWETTHTTETPTRRPMKYTWRHTLGLYGHYNPAKEITEPNAEQTEVNINELWEILSPSTQMYTRMLNATTPQRKIRKSTTPYVEHTMPNRYNRTVYYWLHERRFALHSTPPPENDSCGHGSFEHTEERPLEIQFMDYLFDTRRNKPTLRLNLTTVTISNREYESFLGRHQVLRKVYENHWRLVTMSHWNIGDTRFQRNPIKSKWGVDFYDRRPYSSTRRQDNPIYDDVDIIGENFTKPDFKNKKYTMADSDDYHDPFVKFLEDPGYVTANWTTVDFQNMDIEIPAHQRYPNGTLKSVEVLIKEDYEFRKNMLGESCEIYREEFAHPDELTRPSAEYIEHRAKQDKYFYPKVNLTIGPKHAQRSVYDVYEDSEYEDLYRKWKVFKKNEPLNNVSLMQDTREETYVDPQVIVDIAYKHTTTYNPFKHETIRTEPDEIGFKFKLVVNKEALNLQP